MRDLAVVRAAADVAELARDALPLRAVGCVRAGDRVGHLVQQDLVNLVVVEIGGEVAGDGDAAVGVVAEARPPLRVIEASAASRDRSRTTSCLARAEGRDAAE